MSEARMFSIPEGVPLMNNKGDGDASGAGDKKLFAVTSSAYLTPPNEEEEFTEEYGGDDGVSEYEELQHIPPPPDGGWGWIIVFASFMCNFIVDGIAYSFGVFFPEFVFYYNTSKSTTSWVGSLLSGCYLMVGPIVSALTNKFGCRPVTIAGSLISGFAFILSTLSPNIESLMFLYGVLGGIGFGCIYLPAIVSVGYYFEKKRAFATGVAVCGSGVGTFVFAPLSQLLLQIYDWKGATIILAGLIFNCMVFGALMRPLKAPPANISRKKPLLQRMAEEKKLQLERGSVCGSSFFTVQLADGTTERRAKAPINMEPGVHSSLNLEAYGRQQEALAAAAQMGSSPSGGTLLPTIQENGRARAMSMKESRPKLTLRSAVQTNTSNTDSPFKNRVLSGVATGLPKNYSSPVLQGMQGVKPMARPSSAAILKLSMSSVMVNGDGRRLSAIRGASSNQLIMAPGSSNGKNNNYSKEQVWVMLGSNEGETISVIAERGQIPKPKPDDYARPMYRKDIFYSGSVANLKEYERSQKDLTTYRASVLSIPRAAINIQYQPGDHPDSPAQAQLIITELSKSKWCPCLPRSFTDTISAMLDFSLLHNTIFMLIVLSNVFGMLGFFVPFVYITDNAVVKGVPRSDASFLLSVIGIVNTMGRLAVGWLTDRPNVDSLLVNNVSTIISGVCIFMLPFCSDYNSILLCCVFFGLFISAYVSLTSIILVDLLGLDKLTNAFGLLILFRGASVMVGPPLAGAVYDATGSYDVAFWLSGSMLVLAALIMCIIPYVKRSQDAAAGDRYGDKYSMSNQSPLNSDSERRRSSLIDDGGIRLTFGPRSPEKKLPDDGIKLTFGPRSPEKSVSFSDGFGSGDNMEKVGLLHHSSPPRESLIEAKSPIKTMHPVSSIIIEEVGSKTVGGRDRKVSICEADLPPPIAEEISENSSSNTDSENNSNKSSKSELFLKNGAAAEGENLLLVNATGDIC